MSAPLDRSDFVADYPGDSFAIAVYAHGKLGWQSAYIDADHIFALLSEQVSNEYLAYLRLQGVFNLFGGPMEIDFAHVVDKLEVLFPILTLVLEGGVHLNCLLLRSGLIDELSLLLYPVVDGAASSAAVFEQGDTPGPATRFTLLSMEPRDRGVLWGRYQVVCPE